MYLIRLSQARLENFDFEKKIKDNLMKIAKNDYPNPSGWANQP
jgi:hypothetical protein